MNYTHLSQSKNFQIYALLKAGQCLSAIAIILCRHRSMLYREISRNSGLRSYRPQKAERLASQRAERSRNAPEIPSDIWQSIAKLLSMQLSPEQISAQFNVSPETIYRYIYTERHSAEIFTVI